MTEDGKLDLEDLKAMSSPTIPNTMAAEALRMDPGRLAEYARKGQLGWKVLAPEDGSRVYHNREDFIRFWSSEPEKPPERTAEDLLTEIIELIRVQNTMLIEINAYVKSAGAGTPTGSERIADK